jgi:hypothetical protein
VAVPGQGEGRRHHGAAWKTVTGKLVKYGNLSLPSIADHLMKG